jgi:hypothetical protein
MGDNAGSGRIMLRTIRLQCVSVWIQGDPYIYIYMYNNWPYIYTQFRLAPDLLERNYCANLGVPDKRHDITSQNHVLFIVSPGRTANLRAQSVLLLFVLFPNFPLPLRYPLLFLTASWKTSVITTCRCILGWVLTRPNRNCHRKVAGGYHFLYLGLAQPQNLLPGIRFLMRLFVIQSNVSKFLQQIRQGYKILGPCKACNRAWKYMIVLSPPKKMDLSD